MQDKEWTFKRPAPSEEGAWNDEPDKAQFTDPATGYPCLMRRGPLGAWCGYVGINRHHPYFKKDYSDVPVDAHGGLTFSSHCSESESDEAICHKVEDGEDDFVWWLGFDCAHGSDAFPVWGDEHAQRFARQWMQGYGYHQPTYKTANWVKKEIAKLALQLKELEADE